MYKNPFYTRYVGTNGKQDFFKEIQLDSIAQIWMSEQSCHVSGRKKYNSECVYPT
jgi:hypothetical protein